MRQYRIVLLVVLLAMTGGSWADNLTLEAVTLEPGETKQVAVSLNNPQNTYTAFQFDLVLPEGITIAMNGTKYLAELEENRKSDHSLKVSKKRKGVYRLMAFSMNSDVFSGTDGPLVYVTLQADASTVPGTKKGTMEEQVLTEASGEQNYLDDVSFSIVVSPITLLKGDVTGDGYVNAADVTALVNYLIGRGTLVNEAAAYVNDDTKIDIADVAALIGLIK